MTLLPIPAKVINVDTITHAENGTWRESNDPNSKQVHGVIIHFIGGTAIRLTGEAADKARKYLSLTQ